MQNEDGREVVLASGSPQRRELLARLGVGFVVRPTSVEEVALPGESPWTAARRLALLKLRAACERYPDRVVLASDTVVDLGGSLYGKPVSRADAARMLRSLRGRVHQVHTAVAVGSRGVQLLSVSTNDVLIRDFSDAELERYLDTQRWADKAGGYAIQDREFAPVERIEGSYSNVVGLPLGATADLLESCGVRSDRAEIGNDVYERGRALAAAGGAGG